MDITRKLPETPPRLRVDRQEAEFFEEVRRKLSYVQDYTVYDDYVISGLALKLRGVTDPDLVEFRNGLFLYAFDGGTRVEEAYFSLHVLHGIKQGTTPTFHVHWSQNVASPSGNVKWQIDYSMAKGYGVSAFPAPTTLSVVQACPTQYYHMITDDDEMPLADITELEPDTLILGRIYRDPTDAEDTSTDDAFLIQIDMHYQRDKLGTSDRNRVFDDWA